MGVQGDEAHDHARADEQVAEPERDRPHQHGWNAGRRSPEEPLHPGAAEPEAFQGKGRDVHERREQGEGRGEAVHAVTAGSGNETPCRAAAWRRRRTTPWTGDRPAPVGWKWGKNPPTAPPRVKT